MAVSSVEISKSIFSNLFSIAFLSPEPAAAAGEQQRREQQDTATTSAALASM